MLHGTGPLAGTSQTRLAHGFTPPGVGTVALPGRTRRARRRDRGPLRAPRAAATSRCSRRRCAASCVPALERVPPQRRRRSRALLGGRHRARASEPTPRRATPTSTCSPRCGRFARRARHRAASAGRDGDALEGARARRRRPLRRRSRPACRPTSRSSLSARPTTRSPRSSSAAGPPRSERSPAQASGACATGVCSHTTREPPHVRQRRSRLARCARRARAGLGSGPSP